MTAPRALREGEAGLWARVVCGVDDSDAGLDAARIAARLVEPGGRLELVSVVAHAEQTLAAERALGRARSAAAGPFALTARRLEGRALDELLAAVTRARATVAVVGSRGHSRSTGIVLGSVTTFLLHEAPCSVLVARGADELARWPRSIVAGVDGSSASLDALHAARALAARFGASLRAIAATQDPRLDAEHVRTLVPEVELHDARPLDALSVASEHADLVVVGSRGLRGIRALASVSERVAHETSCSVLVVRPPASEGQRP